MPRPRIITTLFLACSVLMGAGTSVAFALPQSAAPASAVTAPAAPAVPAVVAGAADTARAARLLGLTPAQVAFVPVCYYAYQYVYVCSGGRCGYIYRYAYVCN